MDKKESLEMIYRQVQKLGLSTKEVAEYLLAKNSLARQTILPGMYVYTDNTISSEIRNCQIKAIVAYVEDNTVYAVCLRKENLPWSGDGFRVPETQNLTDGAEATRVILEKVYRWQRKAEAAQWCYDYAYDGVKKGEAFLPSLVEMQKLYKNIWYVNRSLQALGLDPFISNYWSSTEIICGMAWTFQMSTVAGGYKDKRDKTFSYFVRPMLKIEI